MKIGITGHQEREGISWPWVRSQITRFLVSKAKLIGYSSLAIGTDQVFAKAVLDKGGKLMAVIPIKDYIDYFDGGSRECYLHLLASSEVVSLDSTKPDERAFLDAGRWIVREVDHVVAVWDGEPADGAGGTGDVVDYATSLGKPVLHINPIKREIFNL